MAHLQGEIKDKSFIIFCKNQNDEVVQKIEFLLEKEKKLKSNIPKILLKNVENIFVSVFITEESQEDAEPVMIGNFFLKN